MLGIAVLGFLSWLSFRNRWPLKLPWGLNSVASPTTHTGIWLHLAEGISSFTQYRYHISEILGFSGLTLARILLPILSTYLVALALGVNVPLVFLALLVPTALLLSRIPISIAGIGVHEGVYVVVLSMLAISKSEALQLGVATHALTIITILPGGLIYLTRGIRGGLHGIEVASPTKGPNQ